MTRAEATIRECGVIAIFRGAFKWNDVQRITSALVAEGVNVIEYTLDSPDALATIERLKKHFEASVLVGAGTLLSPQDYEDARAAGAEFFVSPHLDHELSSRVRSEGHTLIPGVFTPTEVNAARQDGWHLQKLFPASTGGPGHLKALRGPFSDVDFIPTGGVGAANAGTFLEAGAVAVGIGSSLIRPDATREELQRQASHVRHAVSRAQKP